MKPENMSSALRYSSKMFEAVVLIVLCTIFLRFFGLSTFEKWQRQDVQIVRRREPRKSLPSPAVTICAITNELMGWNRTDTDVSGLDHCKGEEDLEKCVKKLTFTLGDLLKSSTIYETFAKEKTVVKDQEYIESSAWASKMTDTFSGMCYTLVIDKPLSKGTYLHFILNYNTTAVFVHDPRFFVLKDNNVFVPFLKLDDVFRKEVHIVATTKKRMNRASKFECNADEKYNFGDCVRQKIVESQGCQTPWDLRSEEKFPKCSNLSAMQEFESYYNQVFYSSEEELMELTECFPPCTFTHYSLHDSFSLFNSKESDFFISYALTDLITEEEVLLFPLDSLVSEFGGALGLFLGFSFLGAASTLQTWVLAILAMVKTSKSREGPQSDKGMKSLLPL